jgi:hypothetical protein
VTVFLASASVTSGCGDAGGDPSVIDASAGDGASGAVTDAQSGRTVCDEYCDLVLAAECPNDTRPDCIDDCILLIELAAEECAAENDALLACILSLDADQIECSPSGVAYAADVCQAESDALHLCAFFDCATGSEIVLRTDRSDEAECP